MASPYNLKSTIRSALRKVWLYSPMRKEAMDRARVSRGIYKCDECKSLVGPKNIDIDHIIPATPPEGIQTPRDWGIFIERLLFIDPKKDLRGLCKPCHKTKTYEERYGKVYKGETKKKVGRRKARRTKRLRKA